jgi:hypothetical protein
MSHFDGEGQRHSDCQHGSTTPLPPTSCTTTITPMLNTQSTQVTNSPTNRPSPTNADLSYSTTNKTVTPGNHLLAYDSSTTSPAPEILTLHTGHISTTPSTQSHHVQGTTEMPNTQNFAHQTSYPTPHYNPYFLQFQTSFPPSNPTFLHIIQHPATIQQQHPIPISHLSYPIFVTYLSVVFYNKNNSVYN